MTKYIIKTIDGHPAAVADPAGCFYSTGEVDREMVPRKNYDALQAQINQMMEVEAHDETESAIWTQKNPDRKRIYDSIHGEETLCRSDNLS